MITVALAMLVGDAASRPRANTILSTITIPADTPMHLTTVVPLDSRSVKQGQRFELRVVDDVLVGGVVAIPRGAAAVGEVEVVSRKGMVGQPGRLVLQPLFASVSGERIYLAGNVYSRGADATTGVAVGSLLLTPLGIFITGKSASIAPGTRIDARTRNDVNIVLTVTTPGS